MEYGYRPSSSRSISRTSRMAVEGRLTTGTRHCSTPPEQYRLALTRAATVPSQYPYLDRVIICRVHHATSIIYVLITTSSFSPLVISCPFIILYHPLSSFVLILSSPVSLALPTHRPETCTKALLSQPWHLHGSPLCHRPLQGPDRLDLHEMRMSWTIGCVIT